MSEANQSRKRLLVPRGTQTGGDSIVSPFGPTPDDQTHLLRRGYRKEFLLYIFIHIYMKQVLVPLQTYAGLFNNHHPRSVWRAVFYMRISFIFVGLEWEDFCHILFNKVEKCVCQIQNNEYSLTGRFPYKRRGFGDLIRIIW